MATRTNAKGVMEMLQAQIDDKQKRKVDLTEYQ